MLPDPDLHPWNTVLSARKLHACAGGSAYVWYDAMPWSPWAPLPCSPLSLPRTMLGMRKDENERGFLPYLWKLQRKCSQSGSDDPSLSANTHKDLKPAHGSEMVFGKSDLIPRAKWSLPTEIRKTQSPQQILIWRMHKMFKRAEVSFTFLPLIWDFLPY